MQRSRVVLLTAVLAVGLVAGACGRSGSDSATGGSNTNGTSVSAKCTGTRLESTEIGVSDSTISVEVMADTGSPLAPGLFQGNVDGMNAYAKWVNANGGVGCRQLKVEAWDSHLDPTESKNGLINGCKNDLAMVGGNSIFNPDTSVLGNCADKAGQPVGLPDFAALANDANEACAKAVWSIQIVAEQCGADGKPLTGPRDVQTIQAPNQYYAAHNPGLSGLWMVPGDLPSTIQSATYQVTATQQTGIDVVPVKTSSSASQSAFTGFVQQLKDSNGTYVYNGATAQTMVKMRKEAAAQGYDGVKVWACSLACYTDAFSAEGAAVDGTYVWTQFIPFEEASNNEVIKTYLDAIGNKPDAFGLQAWQAGMVFKETIDRIVAKSGPNAITRQSVIDTMATVTDFTAGGSMAPKGPKGASDCYVLMQFKDGKFVRITGKPGEFDCNPNYVVTLPAYDVAGEAAKIK